MMMMMAVHRWPHKQTLQKSSSMLNSNSSSSRGGGQEQEQEEQKQQKGGKAISLATECSAAHALLAHPAIMSLCNGVLGRQVLRKDRAGLEASLAPPSLFTDGRTYIPVYTCM